MSDRVSLSESLPRSCASLYAGETRHSDPQGRTRLSAQTAKSSVFTQIGKHLALEHSEAYVPKHTRPAFDKNTQHLVFDLADKKDLIKDDKKVVLYACTGFAGQTVYLPKKADLKLARDMDESINDYATIGHMVQWRGHIASNANPERYVVEINNKDYEVYAYLKDDVRRLYNDTDNLRLESQSYNSSVAYSYESSDDPLAPTFRAI